MMLEDFFTLAEMKSGLTTLARVEELISKMQQQNDSVMNNVGDTARQRSTVASTLAATESKDCLEHFVKLNGLCFLNQWLQEGLGLKGSNDIADSAFEELMHALLGSLEKLPIDQEKSFVSGIHTTIEQLFGLKGLYKERARALCEKWKNAGNCQDIVRRGTSGDDKYKCSPGGETIDSANSTHLDFDNTHCRERTKEGSCRMESAATEDHHSDDVVCHEASGLNIPNDVLPSVNQILPSTSSSTAEGHANLVGIRALSSVCPADEMTSTGTWCAPNATGTHINDITCDSSMLKDSSVKEVKMEMDTKEGNPCKSGQQESYKILPSSTSSATSPPQKPERSVSCSFEFREHKTHVSEGMEPLPRSASVGCVAPKYLRTMAGKSIRQESNNGSELKKGDNTRTSFPRKQVMGNDSEDEELGCSSELIPSRNDSLKMERMEKSSELGLEDGELDALEVAWQVAIEVEREVVDYREPFCSSSPEGSSGNTIVPQSSFVVDEHKQDQPAKEEINGNISLPDSASSPKDERLKILETVTDPDTCEDEMPKRTTDAVESVDMSDRDRCDFDLNEEVGNEEHDSSLNPIPINSVSVSAPIAVAASKGTPLFPVAPLCFEGELGWRGSAATSAFRPASPWRTDTEKTYSGQKRKSNLIEFDLNIAESGDDDVVIELKTTPVSPGFRSQDDSMEVSSKRADKLKLDLNRLGDEDVSPDELSVWRLPHHNGDQPLSPASSSSSRQPSTRDFDLNDNPGFLDAVGSHNHTFSSARATGSYESSKFDASAITIMGSRMVVERKDYLNDPRQSSIGSRPSVEPIVMMASRPMLPYTHIPLSAYAYNGQVMGPPMSLPTSIYGPGSFQYMVDTRGTTAMPQFVGSAGVHGPPSATPSFLLNVSNTPSTLNVVGPPQSFLDLNSGLSSKDAGNRDVASLKHVFMPGHNGLT